MTFERKQQHLTLQTREAPVSGFDQSAETFDMVWSTGARVRRFDPYRNREYWEELSMDPADVRMERLTSGKAPILDSHRNWNLADVLGVITRAWIDNGKGLATAKLSKRKEVEPVAQDLGDGIIGNISVGYAVYEFRMIEPTNKGELWIYRAVDWEPMELSLVSIGADAGATAKREDGQRALMARANVCTFQTALHGEASISRQAERDAYEAVQDERAMVLKLVDICEREQAPPEIRTQAIAEGWNVERLELELLNLEQQRGDWRDYSGAVVARKAAGEFPATLDVDEIYKRRRESTGNAWDQTVRQFGGE